MKLACLQTASLRRYACVSMEARCSWQQADYELLWAQRTYVPKYEVVSEELQTAKFGMHTSVAMVTILSYLQVIKFIVIT